MIEQHTATVVGMGEVGRRLVAALGRAGWTVQPVTRHQGWETLGGGSGPVIVCVREEALPGVVQRLGGVAPERLVFVQNGWIRPFLTDLPGCGRGLIWFTSKGEFYEELRPSPFSGAWAVPLAAALNLGGLAADAVSEAALAALEAEKMGFNCVVGLPLAVHGLPLGEYLERRGDEARQVFEEAVRICARALDVPDDPAWWAAFERVARSLAWVKVREAKAVEFRNGAVARLGVQVGMPAPVNGALLARAGFPLPPAGD